MRGLSPLARVYIWTVLCLGDLVFLYSDASLPESTQEWLAFGILTVAAAAAQAFPVVTPKNQAYELTPIFVFAAVLLLPSAVAASLIMLAFLPEWIKARKPWFIQLFNIAIYLIQAFLARGLYVGITADANAVPHGPAGILAAVLAALLFTAVNHLLLAVVLHLARGHSWRDTRLFEVQYFLTDATLACTGIITALLWHTDFWLAVLIVAPLFLIYRALNTPNLQEEARTDPKTGLYNAKHFNRVLQEELRRAVRFNRPLAVIMADLDLLRNINSRYGHIAGDVVISEVAGLIKGGLREYDLAARFGGEEFVILLPETNADGAVAVAERICHQVEHARFAVPTCVEPIRATLSLGVASFQADADSSDDVVHQADLAVYHAKLCGRNQVRACSPESRALGQTTAGGGGLATALESPLSAQRDVREISISSVPIHNTVVPDRQPGAARSERSATPSQDSGEKPENERTPAPAVSRWRTGGSETPPRVPGRRERTAADPSLPVAVLVFGVVLAASAVWAASRPWETHLDWLGLVALGILTVGAQSLAVEIYGRGRISTSAIVLMAGGMIFGMPAALILAPLVPLTVWIQNRGRLHRALFDLGDISLSSAAAVVVYGQLSALLPGHDPLMLASPAVLAALAYYTVNVGLISAAIGLTEGRSPLAVWREKFAWLPLHYMVFGPLALLIAVAYHAAGLFGLFSFFVPAVMLRYVMKQYIDRTEANVAELKRVNEEMVVTLGALRETYEATLLALSAALDSRDTETEGHCKQVVEFTAAIARQLDLPDREMSGLLNGALLHDVGKIGVPDAILRKRGPLTSGEWEAMREHPELGCRMLQPINFLKDALPVVRCHHERYDGRGYPHGLRGEEIPLGARIFAVADAFHAMISDRPYRLALPMEEARAEVARSAGRQFDPRIVKAFLQLDLQGMVATMKEPAEPDIAVLPTRDERSELAASKLRFSSA